MLDVSQHSLTHVHFPTKRDTRKRIPITGTIPEDPNHTNPRDVGQGSPKTPLPFLGVSHLGMLLDNF